MILSFYLENVKKITLETQLQIHNLFIVRSIIKQIYTINSKRQTKHFFFCHSTNEFMSSHNISHLISTSNLQPRHTSMQAQFPCSDDYIMSIVTFSIFINAKSYAFEIGTNTNVYHANNLTMQGTKNLLCQLHDGNHDFGTKHKVLTVGTCFEWELFYLH